MTAKEGNTVVELTTHQNLQEEAVKIINNFIKTDQIKDYKKTLESLLVEFICSDSDFNQEYRSQIAAHYIELSQLMDGIEEYQKLKGGCDG